MIALCSGGLPPNIAAVPRDRSPTSHCRNRPRRRPTLWLAAFLLAIAALVGGRTDKRRCCPADERAGAGGAPRRAIFHCPRPAVLARRTPAHEGGVAYLLAQPRRFRRVDRDCVAVAGRLRGRPYPMADAAPPGRRPSHELRLRGRDRAAHPGAAARRRSRAGAPVDIAANVSWLVCQKECIPGEARLSLSLPRSSTAVAGNPAPASRSDVQRGTLGPAAGFAGISAPRSRAGCADTDGIRSKIRGHPLGLLLSLCRDADTARSPAAA